MNGRYLSKPGVESELVGTIPTTAQLFGTFFSPLPLSLDLLKGFPLSTAELPKVYL